MLSDKPFTYAGLTMPPHLAASLTRYAREGVRPGGFLQACLADSLMEAVGQADDVNVHLIPVISAYIYNELPSSCWGSRDIIDAYCRNSELRQKALHMCEAMNRSPPTVPDNALSPDRIVEHFVEDSDPSSVRISDAETGQESSGVIE